METNEYEFDFKIDSDVPVPPKYPERFPFKEMGVGDSFEFPTSLRGSVMSASQVFRRRHNAEAKFSVRKNGTTARIWRIA